MIWIVISVLVVCVKSASFYYVRKHSHISVRGIPTSVCPCGSNLLTIQAQFDDAYEISAYLLDAKCAYCGAEITAPTPLDLIDDL